MINLDDIRIIEALSERSEKAVAMLADKYGALCHKIAANILGSRLDAEECVNDAYLGVWNTIPPEKPNPLISYVCRIVRNLAITRFHFNTAAKRNSAYDTALEELESCFASASTVEDEFDAKATAELIDDFLMSVDKDSRVMFVRRYYMSESISDIAELFDASNHYVSVRLSRIRGKLRAYLIKEGVAL